MTKRHIKKELANQKYSKIIWLTAVTGIILWPIITT